MSFNSIIDTHYPCIKNVKVVLFFGCLGGLDKLTPKLHIMRFILLTVTSNFANLVRYRVSKNPTSKSITMRSSHQIQMMYIISL